jgi:hypothetical protein
VAPLDLATADVVAGTAGETLMTARGRS